MTRITRIEVIDENGRSYVNWKDDNNVSWQFQDDGRTLKVFVNKVKPKSPVEEAYKRWWGEYPGTEIWTSDDEMRWVSFAAGYNASQEPEKEQKWDVVRESVKWCEENPEESVENYLKPHTPDKLEENLREAFREAIKQGVVSSCTKPKTPEETEKSLREAFVKAQQTEEWKETQRKIDGNYDELVESETAPVITTENTILKAYKATFGKYPTVGSSASEFDIQSWNIFQYGFRFGCGELQSLVDDEIESGTEPPEPTSTVFRQKLFDGIKSVFYDPDYERTHWKMKVDMAVDEVLTHFYDILPEPQEPVYGDFDKAWNSCLKSIEMRMEFSYD